MNASNMVGALDLRLRSCEDYLARKDHDLVKLLQYARMLRVESTVKTYLQILL
ncbi:MAG TPA: hypothetical protein PK228_19180 [Saprospiraceae bacterium]|nr:hypothetical protein [Saprospiraceae bacterium]